MRRWVAVAVGGLVVAGLVWFVASPSSETRERAAGDPGATAGDVGIDETLGPAEDDEPPAFEELAGDVAYEAIPGGGLPIPSDPDRAYEEALKIVIRKPRSPNPGEQGREIQEQMRHLSESVELAVAAQRKLAQEDPTRADEAAQRAAELYEHVADELDGVPVPPTLAGDDGDRYREAMDQLAASRRAAADAMRNQGL